MGNDYADVIFDGIWWVCFGGEEHVDEHVSELRHQSLAEWTAHRNTVWRHHATSQPITASEMSDVISLQHTKKRHGFG